MLIYFRKAEQRIYLVFNTLYDCNNKQKQPNRSQPHKLDMDKNLRL